MYQPDDILDGARSIRPYLPELLDKDADAMDHELANLLAQAQAGQKVDNRVLALLAHHEATRGWMAKFLEHKRPPEVEKLYTPPLGMGEPMPVPKYACPKRDYVWYRRIVGQPVPRCPTHDLPLEPVQNDL